MSIFTFFPQSYSYAGQTLQFSWVIDYLYKKFNGNNVISIDIGDKRLLNKLGNHVTVSVHREVERISIILLLVLTIFNNACRINYKLQC